MTLQSGERRRSAAIRNARALGAVLSSVRLEAGLTQEAAAAKSTVPRPYLATLETGKDTMALTRLFHLLEAYGAELRIEWTRP